ncbi:hypothetical protein SUGI_1027680 [Cryptomeria japonica]|nr:hypothetical protein SUGI_1027680 [Cryptomeria japonica]
MGWGWTKKESAEQSQPPEDDDQIHKDVLLAGRDACYKARDMFYACVEKNVKSKPTEIASVGLLYPAECKRARTEYEKQCRPTWVKHFDRQYSSKKRVERLLETEGSRKGI